MVTATATFEDDMKVKMASESVPDVFSTHGWSVMRYAPFLEPLDSQPWVKEVKPGLKDIMFDQDGHIYALPLEYSATGFLVNHKVLKEAGVDPAALSTWEGFDQALAAVKEIGKIPLAVAGKEQGSGNLANFIASGQFTAAENEKFQKAEFDTALWQKGVSDRLEKWQKRHWFNPDYSSASVDDVARQLADGSAAFGAENTSVLATALEYNSEADLGFIPIPGVDPFVVGGEGNNTYGVSKTSANKELAIKFVNFIAEPKNAVKMLQALAADSGLANAKVDLGKIQPSIDKYVTSGKFPTKPFFDRVYLPGGMWDTIVKSSDGVITGQLSSADAAKQLFDHYQALSEQQK
ncbi:extracellular solute-binding protein [Arcanobacterium hippocoleae]